MVHPEVGAVGAKFLGGNGEFDRLEQRVRRGADLRLGRRRPMAEREKSDLLHWSRVRIVAITCAAGQAAPINSHFSGVRVYAEIAPSGSLQHHSSASRRV